MKVSIEWLRDYVDIDCDAKELAERLTMSGSKVEGIEYVGEEIVNVVVGKILKIEKHPDADKLIVTQVDLGDEKVQIVTGAKNVKEQDIVPIAKNASTLPGGVHIKTGKLRGIQSQGMMCSLGELKLDTRDFPDAIEDGIFILPKEMEKDLGRDIREVLHLNDEIIEFEITPNRPDCLSVVGLAKETAVTLDKPYQNVHEKLEKMKPEKKEKIEGISVKIENPESCNRYCARVATDIKIEPSPEWMRRRLRAAGIRPINNIVDITNYVMIELGQPLHAFDAACLEDNQIVVRIAKENEDIITLDSQERKLTQDMLVIADGKKPVGIAGVMGGFNSEITEGTKMIVVESAKFDGASVRKTAKKLGFRTEASARFEKGLDAETSYLAANRAMELIELLGAGVVKDGIIDLYPVKQEKREITVCYERINQLLGMNLSESYMNQLFAKLEMPVVDGKVLVPSYRSDVEGIADLAEEVARFYGYDKIETSLIKAETTLGQRSFEQIVKDDVKTTMYANGFSEIYCYGFTNMTIVEKMNLKKDEVLECMIPIKNPLSEDHAYMRTTTMGTMLETLARNYNRKNVEAKLFEIGKIFNDTQKQIEQNQLPEEKEILSIGAYGKDIDFYAMKGTIESIFDKFSIVYEYEAQREHPVFHPGRTANLVLNGKKCGILGEVHPLVLKNFGIDTRVYMATIDMAVLIGLITYDKQYQELPKYPAVERDLAMVIDENVPAGEIEKVIKSTCGKLLEKLELFDIYQGSQIATGKKSMAYSLILRDVQKTLTEDEISGVIYSVIDKLEKEFNAELRR